MSDSKQLVNYHNLRKYYINLDSKTDRRKAMEEQIGDDFIRFSACNGSEVSLTDLERYFDINRNRDYYQVIFSANQMACSISHYAVYDAILNSNDLEEDDWVLIGEDDNKFVPCFKEKLDKLLPVLYSEKYKYAELVILRLYGDKEIDYAPYLPMLKGRPTFDDSDEGKLPKVTLEELKKYNFGLNLKTSEDRINPVMVPLSIESRKYTNGLFKNGQYHLFTSTYARPYSAALYLIRKRTCRQIVLSNPKPWWFADDFKQIVPLQYTLYCSPFLAVEHELANKSSLSNVSYSEYVHRWNILSDKEHTRRFSVLEKYGVNLFSDDITVIEKSIKTITSQNLDF